MQPRSASRRPIADRHAEPSPVVSVTLCVEDRSEVFRDGVFARHCIDFLRALSTMTGMRLFAYCLMPDRAHLLLGASATTPVRLFVRRWKSLCTREWRRRTGRDRLWQREIFEHAVPGDEDLLRLGNYILMSPVRAGLVEAAEDYPLGGSAEWAGTGARRRARTRDGARDMTDAAPTAVRPGR